MFIIDAMDRIFPRPRARPFGPPEGAGAPATLAFALVIGLFAGALTDILQARVTGSFAGLVNAVSPWLVPAFAAGATARRRRTAAVSGIIACLAELAAYTVTAETRGYAQSVAYVVFWGVGGLVGGAVFGYAGFSWRHPVRRLSGLGPALLSAAFFAEAGYYVLALHYTGDAVVFSIVAATAFVVLGAYRNQYLSAARWLALAAPGGALGEWILYLAASRM